MKTLQQHLIESLMNEVAGNTPDDIYNMAVQLKDSGSVKDVKKVDSDWGKGGYCFDIYYNKGLILKIDFANKNEYTYEYRTDDKNTIGVNSTIETGDTNWDEFLNPTRHINTIISNLTKQISRANGNVKRYDNAYKRSNKSSDYEKYLKEKQWVENWSRRIERYKALLPFA